MAKDGKLRVTRRDFMRIAGLGAGAAAVATVTKPAAAQGSFKAGNFSDPAGRSKRPWWVKVVDEPTVEVDWDQMQRYNERTGTVRGPGMAGYVGDDEVDRLSEVAAQMETQRLLDNVDGYTLKDQALKSAHVGVGRSYLGPQKAKTPEERG
ncbi:MAG: twin-arginine translocation signal domain-containing protein, partial [Anaerolineales bacterium]|nr:twin-arginine translocation signal domain-containing protein [Anaerolineales bacterium]